MKRFCSLVVLMLLSSSAHAGNSLSFVVGGHRIHIEAPRHCRSASCVFVSIPGIYETRRGRDRNDELVDAAPAKPAAAAPAPQQVLPSAIVPPASKTSIQPVASASPPTTVALAASTTREVAPPPAPIEPTKTPPMPPAPITPPATGTIVVMPAPTQPIEPPPIETPLVAAPVTPVAPAPALKISREEDEPAATPLGDWQTEAKKGSVRIEPCGHALCGYILDPASNAAGETLLINMKPKAASQWSGNIFSRDSGNTYYATMALKGPNSLRVEACALGRFFCSGNVWTRITAQPDKLVTSRQVSRAPRT